MMTSIIIKIITLLILQRLSFVQLSSIPNGYWRSNEDSTLYYRCLYGTNSCIGGEEFGENSCINGFFGFLCSECEFGKTINLITLKCEYNLLYNNNDINITSWKYIELYLYNFFLILPFGIIFPSWICFCTSEYTIFKKNNAYKKKKKQSHINNKYKNIIKDIQIITKETIDLSSDDDSISFSQPTSPTSSSPLSTHYISTSDIELGLSNNNNIEICEIKKNLFVSFNKEFTDIYNDINNNDLIKQNKLNIHNKNIMNIIMRIKIVLSSMQICSSITRITGVSFPGNIVTTILRIYSNMSFSITSNYVVFEYLYDVGLIDSVKVFINLHLFVSVFVLFYFCLRRELMATRFRLMKRNNVIDLSKKLLNIAIKSGIILDIIHYFLINGILFKIISIFQCIIIDSNFSYRVIREDVTISCDSTEYNEGILWGIFGLFCYILSMIINFIINLRLNSLSISYILECHELEFTIFSNSLYKLIWIATVGYGHIDIYWNLLENLRRVTYIAIMPLLQLYSSLLVQIYFFIGLIFLNILMSYLIIENNKRKNKNIKTIKEATNYNNKLNNINEYTQLNLSYSLKANYQIIIMLLGVIIIHIEEENNYIFLNNLYIKLAFDIGLSLIVLWIPVALLYYSFKDIFYNTIFLNDLEIDSLNIKLDHIYQTNSNNVKFTERKRDLNELSSEYSSSSSTSIIQDIKINNQDIIFPIKADNY